MSSSVSTTVSEIDLESFIKAESGRTETQKEASTQMFEDLNNDYPHEQGLRVYICSMDENGNIFGSFVEEPTYKGGKEGGCNGFVVTPVLLEGSIGFQLTLLRDVKDEGDGKYISKIMYDETLGYTPDKKKIFSNLEELTDDGIDTVDWHFSQLWYKENDSYHYY